MLCIGAGVSCVVVADFCGQVWEFAILIFREIICFSIIHCVSSSQFDISERVSV